MSTQSLFVGDTPAVRDFDVVRAEALRSLAAPSSVDEHLLGNQDFYAGKSLTELAREQGVGPIKDIGVFAGGIPDDVDVDELLAQLEELRSS